MGWTRAQLWACLLPYPCMKRSGKNILSNASRNGNEILKENAFVILHFVRAKSLTRGACTPDSTKIQRGGNLRTGKSFWVKNISSNNKTWIWVREVFSCLWSGNRALLSRKRAKQLAFASGKVSEGRDCERPCPNTWNRRRKNLSRMKLQWRRKWGSLWAIWRTNSQ